MSDGAAVPADASYDVVDAETGEVIKITGEEAKLLDEDEEEGEDVGGGLVIGIDRRDGVESTVGAIEAAEAAAATPAPPAVDLARCSFTGHSGPVYSTRGTDAALGLALSGGGDDAAYLWDVATGAVRHALTGHADSIVAVGLNCDGSLAATASLDSSVKVWSVASGELLHTLEGPSEDVVWMTWHQKGNVVLAGSSDGTAWMWHVAPATATKASAAAVMQVFAGHESSVTCGCFSPNGKIVCTAGTDGTLRLWKPKGAGAPPECVHVFRGHGWHDAPIVAACTHPTSPLLMTGDVEGCIRVISIRKRRVVAAFRHAASSDGVYNSVEAVGFCSTHGWCASGGMDDKVYIWDLEMTMDNNRHIRHRLGHPAGVVKLQWHRSEPLLFTCCLDGIARLFDARDGQCLFRYTGHNDIVLDICLLYPTTDPAAADSSGADAGAGAAATKTAGAASELLLLTGSDDGLAKVFTVDLSGVEPHKAAR
jgi:ribosome assembly protein SQT1